MIVTTTNNVDGAKVKEYLGIVDGSVLLGANIVNDIFAGFTDVFGGRSSAYERKVEEAKKEALEELTKRAHELGANAIIGVSFDVQISTMVLVMVTGTAVKIEK